MTIPRAVLIACLFATTANAQLLSPREKLDQLDRQEQLDQQREINRLQLEQLQQQQQQPRRRLPPTISCEPDGRGGFECQRY